MMAWILMGNAIVAALAGGVFLLWAMAWHGRGVRYLSLLYSIVSAACVLVAAGQIIVLIGAGDLSETPAMLSRYAGMPLFGLLAIARLLELIREAKREAFATRRILAVRARASGRLQTERPWSDVRDTLRT